MRIKKRVGPIIRRIQIVGARVVVIASLAWSASAAAVVSAESSTQPALERSGQEQSPAATVRWEMLPIGGAGDEIRAIAVAGGTQFAAGDSRGVLVGPTPDVLQRHWLRGDVRHVQFIGTRAGGTPNLLVATESGLYRVGPEPGSRTIAPAPGAGAAVVSRIATAGGVTAIATDDGVFLSRDGLEWQRLTGLVPIGPASSVALRKSRNGIECWAMIRGQLWRIAIETDASGSGSTPRSEALLGQKGTLQRIRQLGSSPVELPFRPGGRDPVDIALDIGGVALVVVYDSTLVVRRSDRAVQTGVGWEVVRPELPPGSSIVELAQAIGWFWLATDRGLFRARTLLGPWVRASGPLAARPIGDLAINSRDTALDTTQRDMSRTEPALYVATDRGLMVATAGPRSDLPLRTSRGATTSRSISAPRPLRPGSNDPGIDRVHHAALDYLDLDRARIIGIHRGLDRRGWLPKVGIGISRETDRSRASDYDEAYISGDLRGLRDWDRDRSTEWELRLTLSWDLGDIAYHPERLDVSREAREIIELRDEVLDEVTQLYFERQRVLAQLHSLGGDGEALPLRIRADQLSAGIDAWTGGWFSRRVRESDPLTPSPNRDPVPREPAGGSSTRDSGQTPSSVPNP